MRRVNARLVTKCTYGNRCIPSLVVVASPVHIAPGRTARRAGGDCRSTQKTLGERRTAWADDARPGPARTDAPRQPQFDTDAREPVEGSERCSGYAIEATSASRRGLTTVSFDIMGYLAGCLLLLAGGIVGWWASRRYAGRTRGGKDPKPGLKADAAPKIQHAATSEKDGTIQAEPTIPREWDGGPLRPDLNRQLSLGRGLR